MRIVVLVVACWLALLGPAHATSRHFRPTLTKTTRGVRITVAVQAAAAYHPEMAIGVHEPTPIRLLMAQAQAGRKTTHELNVQQSGLVATPCGQACEVVLDIDYAQEGFSPGQQLRLMSTWPNQHYPGTFHVWGHDDPSIVLP